MAIHLTRAHWELNVVIYADDTRSLYAEVTLNILNWEALVPMGRILPPGNTNMDFRNWKLKTCPGHFGFLALLNHRQRKEGGTELTQGK